MSHLKGIYSRTNYDGYPLDARYPPYTNHKKFLLKVVFAMHNFTYNDIFRIIRQLIFLFMILLLFRKGYLTHIFDRAAKLFTFLADYYRKP